MLQCLQNVVIAGETQVRYIRSHYLSFIYHIFFLNARTKCMHSGHATTVPSTPVGYCSSDVDLVGVTRPLINDAR